MSGIIHGIARPQIYNGCVANKGPGWQTNRLLVIKFSSWWRHQMETFSALLALCAGNSPVNGEFPSQRPVTRSFDVSLICAWINAWVNNREAGDLRRHCAHYDVTVMYWEFELLSPPFLQFDCYKYPCMPWQDSLFNKCKIKKSKTKFTLNFDYDEMVAYETIPKLLTHKQLTTNGCLYSTMATDGLVLMHETINI